MQPKQSGKGLILIAEDEQMIRQLLRRTMEKDGYEVLEAENGQECLTVFEDYQPDIVIMDGMMPIMDGPTACAEIQKIPGGEDTPVLMVTALNDDEMVHRAFESGASDFLTKPVHWAVLRHRVQRLIKSRRADQELKQLIEDMNILHRIDRELGYTLEIQRVLDLTMDTAVRRAAAAACMIAWIKEGTNSLQRISTIGRPSMLIEPVSLQDIPTVYPDIAKAFEEKRKSILETRIDDEYGQLILPLSSQGEARGLIGLERVPAGMLTPSDFDFLIYLASRTADAIEKTQTYQKTQLRARQMNRLHEISSEISSHLNRKEVIELGTRGQSHLLKPAGTFFCEYDTSTNLLRVQHVLNEVEDELQLPEVGTVYRMDDYPGIIDILRKDAIQIDLSTPHGEDISRQIVQDFGVQNALLVPLNDQDGLMGIIVLCQHNPERLFLSDEIALARSLAGQVTVALQNATLFFNVQELEQVKSEMIRMASHDLRNPLTQIAGYLHLLVNTLESGLDERQQKFLERIQRGIDRMQNLLEDILNIEKIESQRADNWETINISTMIRNVCGSLQAQAELKKQKFIINIQDTEDHILGSPVQLEQAFNNFVNNAIKYTPEEGQITVNLYMENGRAEFSVKDTGYGIPEDRQEKIFQRFYRAMSPGTEDIEGTGLGLSLVKAVIEKHGGGVWFESAEGKGSTFGAWLPILSGPEE